MVISICRVKDTSEVWNEGYKQNFMPISYNFLFELSARDYTFDDVLRVHIEVWANVEQPRHHLVLFVEFKHNLRQVSLSYIFNTFSILSDGLYFCNLLLHFC